METAIARILMSKEIMASLWAGLPSARLFQKPIAPQSPTAPNLQARLFSCQTAIPSMRLVLRWPLPWPERITFGKLFSNLGLVSCQRLCVVHVDSDGFAFEYGLVYFVFHKLYSRAACATDKRGLCGLHA